MGHAKALAGIDKIDKQLAVFQRTLKENLSVRQVEELARLVADDKQKVKATDSSSDNPHLLSLKSRLTSYFGTKVSLRADKNNKGEIRIPFMSAEDLERILELIHFKH
jgi:ParB family chromosome partitioning protein